MCRSWIDLCTRLQDVTATLVHWTSFVQVALVSCREPGRNWNLVTSVSALTLLVWCQEEHLTSKKLGDEVLAWLPVWSKVQMICIWFSWCHLIIYCFIRIQMCLTFLVPAYRGCPGKEAIKWVSVCLSVCHQRQSLLSLTVVQSCPSLWMWVIEMWFYKPYTLYHNSTVALTLRCGTYFYHLCSFCQFMWVRLCPVVSGLCVLALW